MSSRRVTIASVNSSWRGIRMPGRWSRMVAFRCTTATILLRGSWNSQIIAAVNPALKEGV